MCGSTILLVTQEYAKLLPTKIAKCNAFKSSATNCATIRDLLPTKPESTNTKFVFVLVPNTLGIPAGEGKLVKGKSDANLAEHFRDLGSHAAAWFTMMTEGHTGIHPFSVELQTGVSTNKDALGATYPKHSTTIHLTPDQLFVFKSAPAKDDKDGAIYPTLAKLRS